MERLGDQYDLLEQTPRRGRTHMDLILRGFSKVWNLIDEPRFHRLFWLSRYLLIAIAGFFAIFSPPNSIANELGGPGAFAWGILLAAGGIMGAVFVLRHSWLWERIAIWLSAGGWLMYMVTVLYLHFLGEGNRLIQAGAILFIIIALVDRYVEIIGDAIEPGY